MFTAGKLIIAVLCSLSACVVNTPAATNTIDIFNFNFGISSNATHVDPTINLGDTVEWVWKSGTHSATAAAGQLDAWDSGVHNTVGFTFDHTFNELGTFTYYCSIHGSDTGCSHVGSMSGKVIVVLTGAVPYRITSVVPEADGLRIRWVTGGICKSNALQRATGTANGSFTNSFTDIFLVTNTTGNVTNYFDSGVTTNVPARYYRVRVP